MHGDLTFRVLGTAALATQSGQEGEISGPASPAPPTSIGNLTVRTTLGRGQFVVIGENAMQGGGLDGPVFYIVHWPENE